MIVSNAEDWMAKLDLVGLVEQVKRAFVRLQEK